MNIADGHLFSPDLLAASRVLAQNGLALLLQTSLLLLPGLWALRRLQRRGSKARGVLGRALLVAVLTSALFSIGLSLRRVPGVWSVTLPDVARREPRVAPILNAEPTRITTPIENRGIAAPEAQQAPASRVNDFHAPPVQAEPRLETEPQFFSSTVSAIFFGAALMWLSGAVLLLLWLSACHGALWRLRRGARVVDAGATLDLRDEVCASLRVRAPLLLCHEAAKSPFLTGLLRPAIVLPESEMWLEAASLRAVLLHEAAHLKRRDLWWSLAGRVGCALLWPQPLLWILCRHLEASSEEACDEAVLRGGCAPHDYARCLLDWAEKMARPTLPERVAGAGVLTGRSSLAQRVTTILDTSRRDTRTPSRRTRVMIVASALLAALATPLLIATHAAPGAEAAKPVTRQKLEHFKKAGDFWVAIGGVSRGVLQKVGIVERRQGRTQMLLQARTARRDAASNRWIFSDCVLYTFSDAKGLEARGNFERTVYAPQTMPNVTEFLEEQSRALDEPLSAAELASKKYPFTIPIAEFDAVNAWAKGRGRATITGRVLDADGKPVAGAKVNLTMTYEAIGRITKLQHTVGEVFAYLYALPRSVRDLFVRQVVTGSDGTYRATSLAGVAYNLSISNEYGRITRFKQDIAPPAQVGTAGQRVQAREDQSVTAPDLTLTRGGLLQVRVENTSGAPLPKVIVSCNAKQDSGSYYRVATDANGQSLFRLPLGTSSVGIEGHSAAITYWLVTSSKGVFYSVTQHAQSTVDGADPHAFRGVMDVQIVPNKTRQVVIRLQPYVAPQAKTSKPAAKKQQPASERSAVIEGEVLDRQSGRPISGVRVEADDSPERGSGNGLRYATSDSRGHYRLRVPPGIINLYILGPWAKLPQSGLRFADTGTEDNSNGVGRFNGSFYDITSWVEVQLDGGPRAFQRSNLRGLRLIPVRPGQTRHATFRLRRMIPVQLKPMPPATAVLEGRVIREDGRPAAGVRVVANMQSEARNRLSHDVLGDRFAGRYPEKFLGLIQAPTYTRSDGTYRLSGLTSAPYDVLVEAEGTGRVAPALLNVTAHEGQTLRLEDMTLTPGSLVRGRVVDAASGVGLPGVKVGCFGPHAPFSTPPQQVITDAQGRYTLRVAPGRNLFFVVGGRGMGVSLPVRVGGKTLYSRSYAALRINTALYLVGGGSVYAFPSQQAVDYENKHKSIPMIQAVLDGRLTTSIRAGGGDGAPVQVQAAQTRSLDFRLKKLDAPASAQQLKAPLKHFGSISPTYFEARSRRHVWQPF